MELCYDGVWGTVCNSLWSQADAVVACRQLGHSSAGKNLDARVICIHSHSTFSVGAIAVTSSEFGLGNGPVLIHDVTCSGYEHNLLDCRNGGIERNSCSHSRDAGIVCSAGMQEYFSCHFTLWA